MKHSTNERENGVGSDQTRHPFMIHDTNIKVKGFYSAKK